MIKTIKYLAVLWICFTLIDALLTHLALPEGAFEMNPVAAWMLNLGPSAYFGIWVGGCVVVISGLYYLSKLSQKAGLAVISILCLGSLACIINNAIVLATL